MRRKSDVVQDDARRLRSIGIGAEIRPVDRVALRAAYETPITNGTDLIDWRITVSAIYSF